MNTVISFRAPADLARSLQAAAERAGVPQSWLIRRALQNLASAEAAAARGANVSQIIRHALAAYGPIKASAKAVGDECKGHG